MKLFKLSTLAIAVLVPLGVVIPAEANVFNLLLQKKHHAHQQSQQHHNRYQPHNRHHSNQNHHSNRRYRYGNRNERRLNNYSRRSFSKEMVFNPRRNDANWYDRHY